MNIKWVDVSNEEWDEIVADIPEMGSTMEVPEEDMNIQWFDISNEEWDEIVADIPEMGRPLEDADCSDTDIMEIGSEAESDLELDGDDVEFDDADDLAILDEERDGIVLETPEEERDGDEGDESDDCVITCIRESTRYTIQSPIWVSDDEDNVNDDRTISAALLDAYLALPENMTDNDWPDLTFAGYASPVEDSGYYEFSDSSPEPDLPAVYFPTWEEELSEDTLDSCDEP
ncbi:hypothetical protein BGZ73_001353 [Actinomortierella ambigua]|nr:hypothetical protein BGZ73_001353 [Actinomortierella ambigua]